MKTLWLFILIITESCTQNKIPEYQSQGSEATQESSSNIPAKSDDSQENATDDQGGVEDEIAEDGEDNATVNKLRISSTAFQNNQKIPTNYVNKNGGQNISPPLSWTAAPEGAGYFVLQMVDLDFQNPGDNPFIHWIMSDIPATTLTLPEAIPPGNDFTEIPTLIGSEQISNYRGPSPPDGTNHRYEFTIYAIKQGVVLNLTNESLLNKQLLEANSLDSSVIVGIYE